MANEFEVSSCFSSSTYHSYETNGVSECIVYDKSSFNPAEVLPSNVKYGTGIIVNEAGTVSLLQALSFFAYTPNDLVPGVISV